MNIAPISSRKLDILPLRRAVKNESGTHINVWREVENLEQSTKITVPLVVKLTLKKKGSNTIFEFHTHIHMKFYANRSNVMTINNSAQRIQVRYHYF
jgi:hypothetical protein